MSKSIIKLLREARATLEMWKDVAPAVSLCADIDAALAKHSLSAQDEVLTELVRYCPHCGLIGDPGDEYRDCCPDGAGACMVPKSFADQCRATFKVALAAAAPSPAVAPEPLPFVPPGYANEVDFLRQKLNDARTAIKAYQTALLTTADNEWRVRATADESRVEKAEQYAQVALGIKDSLEARLAEIQRGVEGLLQYIADHDWGLIPEPVPQIDALRALLAPQGQSDTSGLPG